MPAAATKEATGRSTPAVASLFRLLGMLEVVGGVVLLVVGINELNFVTSLALIGGVVATSSLFFGFAEVLVLLARIEENSRG